MNAETLGGSGSQFEWRGAVARLAPELSARAAEVDETDAFVGENMEMLKAEGLIRAGVPAALGGGACGPAELGDMLRRIAQSCGSTALALSMHTHVVAGLAWRWRRDPHAVAPLLKRIAGENLVLVTSGGSDWLDGSGTAEPAEGGYLVTARKTFASAAPYGDLLMTTAVVDAADGPTVLHFPVPLRPLTAGVTMVDTWRTLGMRGTGSMDVVLERVFVPEASVGVRRPVGRWHPALHLMVKVGLPLIYSVYLGIAEAARKAALEMVAKQKPATDLEPAIGEMDTELAAARLAVADMLAAAEGAEPGPETSNRVLMGRTLSARAAIRTVELALDAAGGAAFYRKAGLERLFRDIQAARFHPLRARAQARFAGRQALGLGIDPDF